MNPAIEVRDLGFRYGDGREALRQVSFRVEPGECVGLIGPNGAGKSTLLLHFNGLLPERSPRQAQVWVDGLAVTAENLAAIRRRVGLLFQDPNDQLFCPTVGEDVAFGPRQLKIGDGPLDALVAEALAQVGLAGFEPRLPHHLSGGEKRRVCLAGVLACRPSILVLDEPTSNLDPRGRRQLQQLLGGIAITKIIATHDLELVAELCGRAIVLDGGRIVADGAAREILGDEALMIDHGLETPASLRGHRASGAGAAT